jgi:nucleoside-diphosphate-sugar epimerase
VWITENVVPIPKNIYGATKVAAEDLCQLFHRDHKLPCLVLRTSRSFRKRTTSPSDARPSKKRISRRMISCIDAWTSRMSSTAHLLAIEKAPALGFGKFIITRRRRFLREDARELGVDAAAVLRRRVPGYEAIYARIGWKMLATLDRVYDNERARTLLGWAPKYDFARVLHSVASDIDPRSELARLVGSKGYHPR